MHYQNDIEKLDTKNSYVNVIICHKELKDGKYSKNVQNCVNSDMFGSNVNDDKIINTMYKKREFIMKTLSYLISQQIIHPRVPL